VTAITASSTIARAGARLGAEPASVLPDPGLPAM
jgi:hypothetical protein